MSAQSNLMQSYYKQGYISEQGRMYKEAMAWYQKGLAIPAHLPHPEFLKLELARLTERMTFCETAEKAVANFDFALKQSKNLVPQLLDARIHIWHQKGKHAEVAATADNLRTLADLPDGVVGNNLYNAARAYALASTCPDADPKTKEAHAAQSVALLKAAGNKGYFKVKARLDHMKKDIDLNSLGQRDDFKVLLAELEKDAK